MPATAFSFTKIAVADLERAEHFYSSVFGLSAVRRITGGEGDHAHEEVVMMPVGAAPDSCRLVLTRFINRALAVPGEAVIGLQVTDIDATIDAAIDAGGSTDHPARDFPEHGLRVALVKDHEGHVIELLQTLARD